MSELNIETIEKLFFNVSQIHEVREFKYGKEFLKLWYNRIAKILDSKQYFFSKCDDYLQKYFYSFSIYGIDLNFEFNIDYLLSMLKLDNGKLFQKIPLNNNNGMLKLLSYDCFYTHYNSAELKKNYDKMDEILVAPLPIFPNQYIVLDGNHRVCKQINDNKNIIDSYVLTDTVTILSLSDTVQIATFCFLFDVVKIIYNQPKYSDGLIRNRLNIFDHNSVLYAALNRKGIDLYK